METQFSQNTQIYDIDSQRSDETILNDIETEENVNSK
jgi:hypothetical protein